MTDLLDASLTALRHSVDSPWPWLLIVVICAANALVPFLPSRTAVITVAVLVAAHPGKLVLLTVLAAAGALLGDCLGYWVGRRAGPALWARLLRSERGRRQFGNARRLAHRHATLLIVAGRHLPGGRTAGALVIGSVHFPWPRFVLLDALGSAIWAATCVGFGYLGGAEFAEDPLLGLVLGFAIAMLVPLIAEFARYTVTRMPSYRSTRAEQSPEPE